MELRKEPFPCPFHPKDFDSFQTLFLHILTDQLFYLDVTSNVWMPYFALFCADTQIYNLFIAVFKEV